jgi:Cytochrome P460
MKTQTNASTHSLLLLGSLFLGTLPWGSTARSEPTPAPRTTAYAPTYTDDGRLVLPANYREWIYLTTGFDMSYNPGLQMGHHMFDNVFVEPGAYKAFVETGTWPDKTVMVLEARGAKDKGSINKIGNYQSTEIMGTEVHIKDTARFADKWAFFGFEDASPAKMIPTSESCYSCHAKHAAVDTTFMQFYPTLLPIAEAKKTLSLAYLQEESKR